jgi:hypothetical protein
MDQGKSLAFTPGGVAPKGSLYLASLELGVQGVILLRLQASTTRPSGQPLGDPSYIYLNIGIEVRVFRGEIACHKKI